MQPRSSVARSKAEVLAGKKKSPNRICTVQQKSAAAIFMYNHNSDRSQFQSYLVEGFNVLGREHLTQKYQLFQGYQKSVSICAVEPNLMRAGTLSGNMQVLPLFVGVCARP